MPMVRDLIRTSVSLILGHGNIDDLIGLSGFSKTSAFMRRAPDCNDRAILRRRGDDGFEDRDVVDEVIAGDGIGGIAANGPGKGHEIVVHRLGGRHFALRRSDEPAIAEVTTQPAGASTWALSRMSIQPLSPNTAKRETNGVTSVAET